MLSIDKENMRIRINTNESELNGREFSIEVRGSLKMNSKMKIESFTLTLIKMNDNL